MAYLKMYGGKISTAPFITIYSAANDTVYYMKNGVAVTVCTTQLDGAGAVAKSALPAGTYTLYSTVAKDLPNDDTTNPYHKTVTVTGNTKEIYVMPDVTAYWYGWKAGNINNYAYKSASTERETQSTYLTLDTNMFTFGEHHEGNLRNTLVAIDAQLNLSQMTKFKSYSNLERFNYGAPIVISQLQNNYTSLTSNVSPPYSSEQNGTWLVQTRDVTIGSQIGYAGISYVVGGNQTLGALTDPTAYCKALWLE